MDWVLSFIIRLISCWDTPDPSIFPPSTAQEQKSITEKQTSTVAVMDDTTKTHEDLQSSSTSITDDSPMFSHASFDRLRPGHPDCILKLDNTHCFYPPTHLESVTPIPEALVLTAEMILDFYDSVIIQMTEVLADVPWGISSLEHYSMEGVVSVMIQLNALAYYLLQTQPDGEEAEMWTLRSKIAVAGIRLFKRREYDAAFAQDLELVRMGLRAEGYSVVDYLGNNSTK